MNKFEQARAQTMLHHPFYGTLIAGTKIIEDPNIPTACTDMKCIRFNPEFVGSLPNAKQIAFVFVHEVMHIALMHGFRRGGRHPLIWNYATDYAINLMLKQSGMEMPACGLIDEKYEGMSAEAIYDVLMEEAEEYKQEHGGDIGDGLPDSDMLGDLLEAAGITDAEERRKIEAQIKQQVAQAVVVARQCGRMPAHIERLITDILHPKVPWQDLLREFMLQTAKDNENWGRRNRRFQDIYLPRRHSERMGEIIFIGDTSGSISQDDLNQVVAEVQAVADLMQPEKIRLMWADAEVAGEQEFECGEPLVFKPVGGGGTDMRVPLKKCEDYEAQVVVLLTDGYTPWPDAPPPFPLIVCCTTDAEVPVGLPIRV